ncbi:uncharacterized protein LOC144781059 isoform X2 [Lissotriton helveticus]
MEVKRCRGAEEVGRCRRDQKKFVLPVNWLLLPQEIFLKIFMYLSPTDKVNIRVTCTHFRILIDHHALWKNSVFVFRELGVFNVIFLKMLQTRRVCSVEVDRLKLYHWKRFIETLPDLLKITVYSCLTDEAIKAMKPLTNLQRLHLTNCTGLEDEKLVSGVCHFQQLTHLWLCKLTLSSSTALAGICQLHNLIALTIHSKDGFVPKNALRHVLFQLPKLKELSLSAQNMSNESMSFCFSPPEIFEGHPGGSSLFDPYGIGSWIHNLPSTLEKLHLFAMNITEPCFSELFRIKPKLRVLDMSFCYGFGENILKQIPREFPLLTKLYLSNIPLTDDILSTFIHLRYLEELDISNNHVLTPEAIMYFRNVTGNSVHIIRKRPARSVTCEIFSTLYE